MPRTPKPLALRSSREDVRENLSSFIADSWDPATDILNMLVEYEILSLGGPGEFFLSDLDDTPISRRSLAKALAKFCEAISFHAKDVEICADLAGCNFSSIFLATNSKRRAQAKAQFETGQMVFDWFEPSLRNIRREEKVIGFLDASTKWSPMYRVSEHIFGNVRKEYFKDTQKFCDSILRHEYFYLYLMLPIGVCIDTEALRKGVITSAPTPAAAARARMMALDRLLAR